MCKRVLMAVLLVLALTIEGYVPARAEQDDQRQDEKISPEEEREALEIAEQFVKSFEEKNDLLSLIGRLYVVDFDARLRKDLDRYVYLVQVEPEVIAQANGEDLRRLYAASLNIGYEGGFLYGIREYKNKLNADDESGDSDPPLSELLPPNVIAVLKTDPITAEIVAEAEKEEQQKSAGLDDATEQKADKDSEESTRAKSIQIESVERLRSYISTLEKASALIREHLKTLSGPRTWDELVRAVRSLEQKEYKSGDDDSDDTMTPRVTILRSKFFGCPEGTRLICVGVLAFHMDLVRVDGKLRILNVYLADD